MAETLKFKQTVNAPLSEVYRAFTNATALREWFCDVSQASARKGGRLYLWWNSGYYACGEFTRLTPHKKIAFTWQGRGEPGATQVQISLTTKGGGTIVTVAHAGVGSGGKWAKARQEFERGWEVGLENLQSVLETGQDLRYVRRPLLGVDIGVFDAGTAAALGMPVTEGVRLDSVVEGRGAQAAGLQKDDVIVRLGGRKVTGWPTLISTLQPRHAGDKVAVVFYRGSEKKTVTMELSRRPLPEVPLTPEALSEAVRKTQAELDAELARCFEGLSEAEASHRPAPGEWSAKETVAHLIANEREVHGWIADLIIGDERWSDENPTNVPARIAATLVAFPTVSVLLEELKRNEAETIAMIAALAPEFVAHKASYWRLGHNLLQLPDHARTHFNQIRAALEAARKK